MNPFVNDLLWIAFAFLCGSLPLSYWLGKLALHTDIRQVGDGNPGAANVWKVGGAGWGMLAILLDGFKGLIPVALAYYQGGVEGWALVALALAPILGHAYSPLLSFNGGKALATTFGVWTAITVWEVPLVLGLSFVVWMLLLKAEGWAILGGMLTLLVYLLASGAPATWLAIWLGSLLIFLVKHRTDLRQPPDLRRGVLGRFFPRSMGN